MNRHDTEEVDLVRVPKSTEHECHCIASIGAESDALSMCYLYLKYSSLENISKKSMSKVSF